MVTFAQAQPSIFAGESGGDYNALYGYQNRPGGRFADTRLTDMTIYDVLGFTDPSGAYADYVRGEVGRTATPVGAYQVVGSTLRDAVDALDLDPSTRFTPEVQDRIGEWIFSTQGTGAWEGYRGPQAGGQGMQMQPQIMQPQQTQPQGFVEQQSTDPFEGLSRSQRMMLGFGALRDAAASLQGQQSDYFSNTLGQFEQARERERLRRQGMIQALPELQRSLAIARMTGQDTRAIEASINAINADLNIQPLAAPTVGTDGAAVTPAGGVAAEGMSDLDRLYAQADKEQLVLGAVQPSTLAAIERASTAAEQARQEGVRTERNVGSAADQLASLDIVREAVEENPLTTTGFFGWTVRNIPGSSAYDLQGYVDTLIANAGFDRLTQMREESPTGGALGQVTVEELRMLQRTIASLDPNLSKDAFMTNLARFENEYKDIIRRAYATTENEAALNMAIGGRPPWLDESNEPEREATGDITFTWD
jgi:hypothetical protein